MGFFSTPSSSSIPAPVVDSLPSFWPPLGLDPAFGATQQTVLSIKSATFGPDWTIVDQEGKTVVLYRGDGRTREILHPRTGELIYQLPSTKIYGTQFAINSSGEEVVSMTEKKNILRSEIFISFDDPKTEEAIELQLRLGKMVDEGVLRQELLYRDRLVGWIIKKKSGVTKTAYLMTVAPGVDLALMTAICFYYDMVINSRKMDVVGIPTPGGAIGGGGGGGGC